MAAQQQLESFHRFSSEQLQKCAPVLSMGKLDELWKHKSATTEDT